MVPNRPSNAICCRSRSPFFGLFHRNRWHSQRKNSTTSYTCERFLVSGFGTPNLHHVASTWPNAGGERRGKSASFFPVRSTALLDLGPQTDGEGRLHTTQRREATPQHPDHGTS